MWCLHSPVIRNMIKEKEWTTDYSCVYFVSTRPFYTQRWVKCHSNHATMISFASPEYFARTFFCFARNYRRGLSSSAVLQSNGLLCHLLFPSLTKCLSIPNSFFYLQTLPSTFFYLLPRPVPHFNRGRTPDYRQREISQVSPTCGSELLGEGQRGECI